MSEKQETKRGFWGSLNLPNKLTLLRVLLVPVYLLLIWCSKMHGPFAAAALRWAALAVFCAASLTDLFDGRIARKYNLVTNFGKFMDPIADKILTHTAFILFTAYGELSAFACIIFVAREFVVAALREIAADQGVVIAAGMSGKIKTVLQMALIILLTIPWGTVFTVDGYLPPWMTACDMLTMVVQIAAVAMTLYSMCEYVWNNRQVLGGDR